MSTQLNIELSCMAPWSSWSDSASEHHLPPPGPFGELLGPMHAVFEPEQGTPPAGSSVGVCDFDKTVTPDRGRGRGRSSPLDGPAKCLDDKVALAGNSFPHLTSGMSTSLRSSQGCCLGDEVVGNSFPHLTSGMSTCLRCGSHYEFGYFLWRICQIVIAEVKDRDRYPPLLLAWAGFTLLG